MGFSDAVRTCLGKYATFSGRASRSEYWWFYLFTFLVFFALTILDMVAFGYNPEDPTSYPKLVLIGLVAIFLPMLSAAIRRLHDTDRSGWWYLIGLVPIVGGIVLLIFLILKGTEGANRFGPDPLGSDAHGIFD
ncbi:DUF805 domain-containing protein [Sandaracinobacteroides hominis]|uniref:DUF805 domain-containing protein n=1 Tax=Sandaracinobacteroides hominis TaxID=2780086 RepID=UPI0018F6953E|nr:DUF805 domain-containing protein [Sandaracinobacteroides hominis]